MSGDKFDIQKMDFSIEEEINFNTIEESGVNDDNDVSELRRGKRSRKREQREVERKINRVNTPNRVTETRQYVQDAYIRGYESELNVDTENGISQDKPLHKYDEDFRVIKNMYTDVDNTFRYSNLLHDYEDPTYMVFNIKILDDVSPLFGFNGTTSMKSGNSAEDFITKYSNIPEIEKRGAILNTFQEKILDIFNRRKYYIQQIGGLNKLTAKMVEYEKDLIDITLSEDVALRASFLAELYNNLCYSYKNQRYLIPDNCLRFDLMIELRDIRVFKIKSGDDFIINKDYPRIIYILRDCNFNFFETIPIGEQSSIAGYSTQTSNTPIDLKFNIRYKSIEKEFVSSLADFGKTDAIKLIRNKQEDIINDPSTSLSDNINDINQGDFRRVRDENQQVIDKTKYSSPVVEGDTIFSEDDELIKSQTTNNRKRFLEGVGLGDVRSPEKGVRERASIIFQSRVNQSINELKREYRKVRGELINSLVDTIRGSTDELGFTRIYPSNVYHEDFGRNASIQNFLKGLGSDFVNLGEDELRGFLGGLPI